MKKIKLEFGQIKEYGNLYLIQPIPENICRFIKLLFAGDISKRVSKQALNETAFPEHLG